MTDSESLDLSQYTVVRTETLNLTAIYEAATHGGKKIVATGSGTAQRIFHKMCTGAWIAKKQTVVKTNGVK